MNKKNLTTKETLALAVQNHQKNNLQVAENLYKEILKTNSNHFESIFYLGTLLVQTQRFELAKSLLYKATQINPNYAAAHNNLGAALKELGEYQSAINCCQKAIQIDPNYADAFNNFGAALKELGEYQKAIVCYEKAIQIQPNHVDVHNNLGIILGILDRVNEAKKYFEKSLNLDPNNKKACKGYGNILLKLNQHSQALEYLRKGTGFIRFTQKNLKLFKKNRMKKININSQQTHFIGCWNLENNKLCNEIINFFEHNKNLQKSGVAGGIGVNFNIKKTTDITIDPNDLTKPKFEVLKQYINELHKCFFGLPKSVAFFKVHA